MFFLDPYAARSCPRKTLNAFDPSKQRPMPTAARTSFPGATEFTQEALSVIKAGRAEVADLRVLATAGHHEQEQACLAAMAAGVEVVIGGLLPRDQANHRKGRAELLIKDPEGGYAPGLVKFQRALDPRRDDSEFVYSRLDDLPRPLTTTGWRYRWNWRWTNAIYLAHLWQLLSACGHQSSSARVVVIGTERLESAALVATWLDLTETAVSQPPALIVDPDQQTQISTLDRYQYEFNARLELAELAQSDDPAQRPQLAPIVINECHYCDWWSTCRPLLNDDDLSLRISKSPLDRAEITALRSLEVSTVAQLAAADLETLLPKYLPLVAHRHGAEDRLRLAQRRSRLLNQGLELERLTTGSIGLPAACLEIDIDVETSRNDRVYLWGFWVADEYGGHYRHFSSFSDLGDADEVELARQAMTWLKEVVTENKTLLFHYSDYEVTRLARLAAGGDPTLQWASAFAKTHFVDLFEVVRKHFFGANGLGLKAVASAGAGFHWRDDDPGGLNSMGWFDTAVHDEDPTRRELARERVLCYNEDDVRATAQLRRWLRELR